ncbi:chemotaxis protein [Erythrobacter sp. QSSC1-22B]|nr:methyl-accepting chemotaxis protein [Erythrobacter sp. QSSC1-22B]OBX18047.1 chemotaxis protein [Erythrobacter sp. QSSC1-22B]
MFVSFAIIAAILATVAGSGIYATRTMSEIASAHVDRGIAGTAALGRLVSALREHRIIIFSRLTSEGPQQKQTYDERLAQNETVIAQAVADYEPLAGEFSPQLQQLEQRIDELHGVNARIFTAIDSQGGAAALPLVKGEGREASTAALDATQELIDLQGQRANTNDAAGNAFASTAFTVLVLFSLAGLAVLFGIWKLIGRTVAMPLAEVSRATTTLAEGGQAQVPHRDRQDELGEVAQAVELFRVAAVQRAEIDARAAAEQQVVTSSLSDSLTALKAGDLTADIHAEFPPAYVELRTNFNEALASLRELIGSVIESAATIRTGSGEIAQASEDLARRTEANAASLEETSAALAQIDERIGATAKAAIQTVKRADSAISTVSGGRGVADEAVQAMTRVSESAKGINDVIEGVDKIAFQTRVLAMNAAVEAGRAGDAGRGFAVVADLVSALAMRAEEEAGRARDQLTATQDDIGAAVQMVQKVDGALADIAEGVAEVHTLLGGMATDNEAQATAISQIASAVGSMDQATQQNASMVEETSAAALSLSGEVNALSERASQFDVGAAQGGSRKMTALPASPGARREQAKLAAALTARPALAVANGRAANEDWTSF